MRKWLGFAVVAAGGFVAFAALGASQEKQGTPAAVKITAADLLFMSGSWQRGSGKNLVEEHWTVPNGGSLIGISRTIAGGKTVFFEFLRMEETAQGVDYVAQPGGRAPVRFACTSLAGRKAVFENPQHDFPTRITYERTSDEELIARVEGPPNAKEESQEFRFAKAGDDVRLPD